MARTDLTPFRLGELMERRWGGDPFMSFYRDMNRLFEDAFRGLPLGAGVGQMVATPRMDVRETDQEVCVETDLPGVSEKDIEVRLDDDVLTIRGERKAERREDKENYHVMERSMGAFQRSMRLPFHVDPQQVQASFENGVLTVRLPKSPQQTRSRRIEVQPAAGQPAQRVAGEPRSFAEGGGSTGETRSPSLDPETRRRAEEAARTAMPE
jgi:HSP20 family protein